MLNLCRFLLSAALLLSVSPAAAQSGGPDASSNFFQPTLYDWVPLAAEPGAASYSLGDEGTTGVALPWSIDFYGVTYNDIVIGSNGAFNFGTTGSITYSNTCLPTTSTAAPDVAVYWEDLNQQSGGIYSFYDVIEDRFIVSWEGVARFSNTGAASFQAHIYSTGEIELHWEDTDFGNPLYDFGLGATIGIQDKTGGTNGTGNFLEWSCNTAAVVDGTATQFYGCTDADGDGASDPACGGTDCDDMNASVYPGALELCDGLDTDCDPSTDENIDADGDGETVCAGDCDDTDATNASGLPEVCDGEDNDCSGLADADPLGEVDGDDDGVLSCDDCDDSNDAVFPGAPEICNAGVDDDCDPATDETVDGDGDSVSACGPDGIADTADDDCDDANALVYPGATELCDGVDNDCDDALLGGGVSTPSTLTTTMAAGNGSSGNIFDLVANTAITINQFDMHFSASGPATVTIFTIAGTAIGNATNAAAWTLHDTVTIASTNTTTGMSTPLPLNNPISLAAGSTTGIYLASDVGIRYTTGTTLGALHSSDANLEFYEGYGVGPTQFSSPFSPRVWNGTIHYTQGVSLETDADGDGYVECAWVGVDPAIVGGDDCDALSASVYPGAPEVCADGVDQDCDGSDFILDVDGDGYSDAGCGADDCDDGDSAVNPGATELVCDGVDNDCDPLTLNENDVDGDGVTDCGLDGILGTADDDCDDSNDAVFPGALEICNAGIDDDCDPATDETVDVDGDSVSSCGPDGIADTADDDCDDANALVYPGATELCDGVDNDCDDALLGGGIGTPTTLTTTMAAGNGSSGNIFDLVALTAVTINQFDMHFSASGPATVTIFTIAGTATGNETNASAWTLHDTVTVASTNTTMGVGTPLPLNNPISLAPGSTTGIYLASDVGIRYTTGTTLGALHSSDANLEFYEGYGVGPTQFSSPFSPRVWNGTIHYTQGVSLETDADGDGYVECAWVGVDPTVIGGDDCDDLLATVYPGAPELCDGLDTDCDPSTDEAVDVDGDGDNLCDGDCDETDPNIGPSQIEVGCDGLDNDCDATTLDAGDGDGDGVDICASDCDDSDPATYPGAPEVCGDGVDQDCDGLDVVVDLDTDGYSDSACGGDDCDDSDASLNPGVTEVLCDGLDNDCDPLTLNENDVDMDGVTDCGADGVLGTADDDCDDANATSFPGNTELCDALDNDCDGVPGVDEVDADGDGEMICEGDCDDNDPANFSGNTELCDGVDNDCNSASDFDLAGEIDFDGDGFFSCADCEDSNANNFPGNVEVCDGEDNDCNGLADFVVDSAAGDDDDSAAGDDDDSAAGDDDDSAAGDDDDSAAGDELDGAHELDLDDDGFLLCGDDCDDENADINPGMSELCDGIDQDCDGVVPGDEVDEDADGQRICDGDCDDADPNTYAGAKELCDGVDNDCDSLIEDEELDTDGDGSSPCEGDCDDTTDTVGLNAEEICDGLDNNCDEVLLEDEDDGDQDGFFGCDDDCDDANGLVNPDALEGDDATCEDGQDNDCDGDIDGADEDCASGDDDDDDDDSAGEEPADCACSAGSIEGSGAGVLAVVLFGAAGLARRRRR